MTRFRMPSAALTAAIVAALALVGGAGYWFGTRPDAAPVAGASNDKAILYWYDPMVPDRHFDKPGKSPFMDMQLVPKYAEGDSGDAGVVRVASATLQNLGVRTARVEVGTLAAGARVPGSVAWDLRSAYEINARADGVIEKLFVRAPYEPVRKGQALAELVAPEWSAAAQEYVALGSADSADARALLGAARNRLRVLGMDDSQIGSLRGGNPRVVLRAPADGVVSMLQVRQGQRVQAGTPLMTVNGLDTVWVEAAIPQAQTAGIARGTRVQASVNAFPGETFAGEVESLLPGLDPSTRTQTARIVLANPDHRLAPGMFADVRFAGAGSASHPLVPDEALIAAGSDTRVIVATGEGRFRPVPVVTGRSADGETEILKGLTGGERIVVSGQFLIDSEASLSGALERLSEPATGMEAGSKAEHDGMAGMDMPAPQAGAGKPQDKRPMDDMPDVPQQEQPR